MSSSKDIAVTWLFEDGSLAGPVFHHIDHYGGIIPSIGDVVAVKFDDGFDSVKVVERYVADVDGIITWHLVFSPTRLPSSRQVVLGHVNQEPEPDWAGIIEARYRGANPRSAQKRPRPTRRS